MGLHTLKLRAGSTPAADPLETHYERLLSVVPDYIPALVNRDLERYGIIETPLRYLRGATMRSLPAGIRSVDDLGHAFAYSFIAASRLVFSRREGAHRYSVDAIIEDPEFNALLKAMEAAGGAALLPVTVSQSKHVAWYELAGKKTYEVSPGLAQRLVDTELRGLKTEDLRLPYPALYICIPPEARLTAEDPTTGSHEVDGIYICEDTARKAGRAWHLLVTAKSKNPDDKLDDASHFFRVDLPDGITLDEALRRAGDEYLRSAQANGTQFDLLQQQRWQPMFRFALNTMIYATWPDADIHEAMLNKEARQLWERLQKIPKGSPKRERLRQEFRQMDPRNRVILGRSVPREPEQTAEHGTGKPLEVRVRVQGHWKRQAHGEGRLLRKTIWIEPYWKGPDDGVLGSAVHRLV